jgi:hypothetical protein
MKSRLTIEVDFENNNRPVIQILKFESDDVRDRLLNSLFQSRETNFLKLERVGGIDNPADPERNFDRYYLVPASASELKA